MKRDSDRDIQGEIEREKHPPRYPTDHIFITNPLYICYNGNRDIKEEKQ